MKGKMKRIRSWLFVLLLCGLLCSGIPSLGAAAETEVSIPVIDGFTAGEVHDAGGEYNQLTYSGVSLSQMKEYEQKLINEGYTLYDQREIKNGTQVNRFATYVNGDMMIHLNLFAPLTANQFHVIYGPSDKLVPNTRSGSYTAVVTPSVAMIERTDGVLCMVVQLADGSYFVIDGGYGYSASTPATIPAKEEHRDDSGITYTYTRDHEKDMETLLAYLQDTNRDGKIDSADKRPQVTWMVTHADSDHIQLPYRFMKFYGSEFDLHAIYYNFPNFYNIGLSDTYVEKAPDLTTRAWTGFVGYKNTYFPNAKEYVYHTGQTVDLPGCTLEFLYTPEDLYPGSMTTPNHTCGMWRFCFDNGKTLLITGDAEKSTNRQAANVLGDYLQSDMMQVIHHGSNGATAEFYNAVDPDICFWPCLDTSFYHDLRHLGTYSGYSFNAILRNGQRTHYTTSSTYTVFLPTLRYDANGGTGTGEFVSTLYCGDAASEGTSPNGMVTVTDNGFAAPDGKEFLGWATTPDGAVQYMPGDQLAVKTDTVLYAVWGVKNYTVTFMDGDSVIKTETVTHGADVTFPELPEKGACSAAWDHDGKNITADTTINAVYVSHNTVHVEAVTSTCQLMGNIEYWYCTSCAQVWLDAQCTQESDMESVKLPLLEAVASIGTVNYGSLEAAVAAANATEEADIITVLKDLEIKSRLDITTDMTITAAQAVEITAAEGLDNHMIHVNGGALTVTGKSQDAKITLTAAAATRNIINIKSTAGVKITNVHLAGNKNSTASKNYANGLNIDGGTVTVENVTVTDVPYRGIRVAAGCEANLNNVSISNVGGHGVFAAGTVNIYGGLAVFNAGFNSNENGINVAAGGKVESHLGNLPADTYAIQIDTTTNRGIIVHNGGNLNISNVSIKNTTSYGVDLFSADAVATITNAIITDTAKAIKAATGSILTVKNVTVQTCEETVVSIAADALTEESEQIAVLRHTEVIDKAVAATCTATGLTEGKKCSKCGETLVAQEEIPATGHRYENGVCTVCGAEDPDYIELFDLKGSSMTLGNTLEINFAVDVTNLTGDDNYIVVSKEYADERGVVTETYPQSGWTKQSTKISYISFSVSAKEMNDKLTVIVYNGAGQQVSNPYEDSVAGYCLRMLKNEEARTSPRAKYLTLYVDMLNYGAAAQTMWTYNIDALANAALTEAQQAYATVVTEKENILAGGDGYKGTSLSLKENILMNIAFTSTFLADVKYAVVTFVDHNGNDESVTVPIEDFVAQGTSVKYISLECMAVADYAQPVTVQLYNAADEVISTTVDSMGSYAGRQTKNVYLYDAILAFGKGAYNYFHS